MVYIEDIILLDGNLKTIIKYITV